MPTTRGWFTVVSGPHIGKLINFHLNPEDIKDNMKASYTNHHVVGISHPVYQYTSGDGRKITFDLPLDGYMQKRNITAGSMDIRPTARAIRSLLYPESENMSAPSWIKFTFGELYKGLLCCVTQADVHYTFFTEKLVPIKAKVAIELTEVVEQSVLMSDVWNGDVD